MRIAQGGLPFIIVSLLVTVFFMVATFFVDGLIKTVFLSLFVMFLLVSLTLIVFFRDPERKTGNGMVAVADGRIREISNAEDKDVGECTKISTFMNVHNVHVNRMPLDGVITEIVHLSGAHLPAFQKNSEKNERVLLLLNTSIGIVKIVQIAGTLARRIVPYVKKGDTIKKGERIGIIRFGSRVDLVLPTKKIKSLTVSIKDTIKAGEDTIAELYD